MKNTNKGVGCGLAGVGAAAVAVVLYHRFKRSIPKGAQAVEPFDIQRYLGKWYEIARLPMRFEKNMEHVTAEYIPNRDGSVEVHNVGYDLKKEKWNSSTGRAVFAGKPTVGMLKVSFFGPFYSGYNIIEVDSDYKYALVAGENLRYMWLLSREKSMPDNIRDRYLARAKEIGYDTSSLIWTPQ